MLFSLFLFYDFFPLVLLWANYVTNVPNCIYFTLLSFYLSKWNLKCDREKKRNIGLSVSYKVFRRVFFLSFLVTMLSVLSFFFFILFRFFYFFFSFTCNFRQNVLGPAAGAGAAAANVCHKNSKFVHLSYLETSFNYVISTGISFLVSRFSFSPSHSLALSAFVLFSSKWRLFVILSYTKWLWCQSIETRQIITIYNHAGKLHLVFVAFSLALLRQILLNRRFVSFWPSNVHPLFLYINNNTNNNVFVYIQLSLLVFIFTLIGILT